MEELYQIEQRLNNDKISNNELEELDKRLDELFNLYNDFNYPDLINEIYLLQTKCKDLLKNNLNKEKETKDNIEEFNKKLERLENKINEALKSVSLELDAFKDINLEISELTNELKELSNEANNVLNDINGLNSSSLSKSDITKRLKDLRNSLCSLKKVQITKYNAKVYAYNEKLKELKNRNDLPDEIKNELSKLNEFSICGDSIKTYMQNSYMKKLKYNELINSVKSLNGILNKLNNHIEKEISYEEMNYIDDKLNSINANIDKVSDDEKIKEIREDIVDLKSNINNLKAIYQRKLDNGKITEEEKDKLFLRLDEFDNKLKLLEDKTNAVTLVDKYNDYENKIDNLESLVDSFIKVPLDESLADKIDDNYRKEINKELDKHINQINELRKEIDDSSLTSDQKDNLNKKLKDIEYKITESRFNVDVSEELDKEDIIEDTSSKEKDDFDEVERKINKLNVFLDKHNKPLNKETRKKVEIGIKRINKLISKIEKDLEDNKDVYTEEEYNSKYEKLLSYKDKLENINTKYKSKTSLRVRAVKSAKNFYKKHKKIILVSAGLAAIALIIDASLGFGIIPSIMHGNIMVINKSSILAPVFKGFNKILGSISNAKYNSSIGEWTTSAGKIINPYYASTNLLKGLAISGINTAAILTPVIALIRGIVNKIKKKETTEKVVTKENITVKTKSESVSDKYSDDELKKLEKEYEESDLLLDDFLEVNKIDKELGKALKYYIENKEESSGRGRR